MYGAILGDMIGAPYEFDRGNKTKDFPLFVNASQFTDDTVMTIAVAEALMETDGKSDDEVRQALVEKMQDWGRILERVLPCTDIFVPSVEELCFMLDRDRYDEWISRSAGGFTVSAVRRAPCRDRTLQMLNLC